MSSSSGSFRPSDWNSAAKIVRRLFELPDQDVAHFDRLQIAAFALESAKESTAYPDIFMDDVIYDVQGCRTFTNFCQVRGYPVLCVEPEGSSRRIPVIFRPEETEKLFSSYQSFANPEMALAELVGIRLTSPARLVTYAPIDALGFYKSGLSEILAVRLAAFFSGGTKVARYKFELSNKTPGLTAYWTLAASLQRGNYFGYPTFPVVGSLPAGVYCFGAGTTGGTATYDMTTYFDIPTVDKGYVSI